MLTDESSRKIDARAVDVNGSEEALLSVDAIESTVMPPIVRSDQQRIRPWHRHNECVGLSPRSERDASTRTNDRASSLGCC